MQSAQSLRRTSLPATAIAMLAALLMALVVGGVGGYAIKALSTPAVGSTRVTAACPAGMHAVVWYSAKTWTCQSDS
jgi:hypothetical protein